MQQITFLDGNDILTTAKLDGTQYKIRMLWNDAGGFWTLSLRDSKNNSLLEGVKCVPDFPILAPYHRPGIPAGEFVITTLDTSLQIIGRKDFVNKKAVLIYVTEDEMDAI